MMKMKGIIVRGKNKSEDEEREGADEVGKGTTTTPVRRRGGGRRTKRKCGICARIKIYTHIGTYRLAHTHTQLHNAHIYIHTRTHIDIDTHTQMYTQKDTHAHTHAQA